ncbi:hypothetical protein NPS53_08400 [Pseudomonas putida]|uniref:hypothetical protein n=1 Tax=Pseudomonas putida TaxID=303 RepID=UPI0023633E0F|nr:hypothetical protein [Pseudomonas putida]MDD2139592.1 hypothetical protein [Pseudomonas putida]HDS1721515.1 hypothetical protein [Pseudomonas putida]
MHETVGNEPGVQVVEPQHPETDVENLPEQVFVVGKKASELDAIFQSQSEAISADPTKKYVRHVHYALVECDTELQRIPLDALTLGLKVRASDDEPAELHEFFIFSLLLATGTLSRSTIDVGPDCTVDPQVVLEEAEAQSLNVRLMLPSDSSTVEAVECYIERLERYSVLWLSNKHASFSLTPLDGYLEYKFAVALGHTPQNITSNHEMKLLFTDEVPLEVMDHIKARLDVVIQEELGGDEFFVAEMQKLGGAIQLKESEMRAARIRMLEEELDARVPVPNLVRATKVMTGLSLVDACGLVYELKNAVHTVLDKYLPKAEGEAGDEYTSSVAQKDFAKNLIGALASGFGSPEALVGAWESLRTKSQLNQLVDLDRDVAAPSASALRVAETLGVDGKVAALATAEFVGIIGSILKVGGAISEIGLERPVPVPEPEASPAENNIIIAVS